MAIRQLSVFVENKEGTLVTITDALANANVDIRAMSIADTQDFGILRLIVKDIDKAKETLEKSDCFVSITNVVAVALSDEIGSLAKAVRILTENKINIEYMYVFISGKKETAYVVLRVENNDEAEKILSENGITIVNESDIEQ